MEANVTVMGYGAVGRETVKLLADRGDKVRVAQRSHPRGLRLEAEFVPTDVLNPESVFNACAGSDAVICCLGFPYDSRIWQKTWPKAMRICSRPARRPRRASSSPTIFTCTGRRPCR